MPFGLDSLEEGVEYMIPPELEDDADIVLNIHSNPPHGSRDEKGNTIYNPKGRVIKFLFKDQDFNGRVIYVFEGYRMGESYEVNISRRKLIGLAFETVIENLSRIK